MLSLAFHSVAYSPTSVSSYGVAAPRRAVAVRMEMPLETWLESKAGVSPKFIGKVIETCEEEVCARARA